MFTNNKELNKRGNKNMRKLTINLLSFFLVLGFITTSSYVDAQTRRAYRVSDRAVDSLLTRIETKTDKYKRSMNSALDNSVLNNTNTEDNVFEYITDFENSTDKLKQRFDAKESVDADVTNVLSRAAVINNFMKSNRLNIAAQRDWSSLRTDLNILARYYSVSFDFNAPIRTNTAVYTKPYRVADDSVKALLMRIETNTDIFKRRLDNALDRSSVNNTNAEDNINDYVKQFENSTDRLKQRFDDNESVAADVETVLNRAASINMFMKDNTLARGAERQWMTLRNDLNTLATYYNVSFDFNKAPMNMNNSNNSALAYTVAGSNVKTLLSNLETKTDTYKRAMNVALDRSVLNNSRSEDAIFEYITEFENATDKLKHNFDAGKSTDANVQEVLNRAGFIDAFMRDYRLLNFAERQWVSIRNV
jgi:archaellum component FlaC